MFIVLVCLPNRQIRLVFNTKIEANQAAALLRHYKLAIN